MPATYLAPPTRREVTIALFGLVVFVLSYNLNYSLHASGLDHAARAAFSKTLGRSGAPTAEELGSQLDSDGRRLPVYRDQYEEMIFGSWEWREGHIADGLGRNPVGEGDRYMEGAVWGPRLNGTKGEDTAEDSKTRGWATATANAGQIHSIPETTLKQHVPGYTILDNVLTVSGSMYIVTDQPKGFPTIDKLISRNGSHELRPTTNDIDIISTAEAKKRFGDLVGVIPGTSWAITGFENYQDSHNLLSLWRTHASLDLAIPPSGVSTLPPPLRVIYIHIEIYETDKNVDEKNSTPPFRSYTGIHPMLLKAALPSIGVWPREDWNDIGGIPRPFVFSRLVLADRGASKRASNRPSWAAPLLALRSSPHWLAPLRNTLVESLRVEFGKKKVVTYLSVQEEDKGPYMRDADDKALVAALNAAAYSKSFEFHHVVSSTPWAERMRAIVRSTVVLGISGDSLTDAVWMRSNSHAAIVELFPENVFLEDMSIPASSLDLDYYAVQGTTKYTHDKLPAVSAPKNYLAWVAEEIAVDAKTVANLVNDIVSRA